MRMNIGNVYKTYLDRGASKRTAWYLY